MSMVITGRAESAASGEFQISSPERSLDVQHKHEAVAAFLQSHEYDALLLQDPANFAWFTSGGDCTRAGSTDRVAALFITPEARVAVCGNADSAQLFERELPGLGFQLKERPWCEPRHLLLEDLCRGRSVASDTGFGPTVDVSLELAALRLPLSVLECERLRELGRAVAHAVEATARNCRPRDTEAEIAAEAAHRLIKRQIVPERLQVMADGQSERHRHWTFGPRSVRNWVTISAVGRRWGLCAAATRTVSFGDPPKDLQSDHHRAALLEATGMFFSQPDWELFEVWNRVQRIYEKYGVADEWRLADQGEVIGYRVVEVPVVPQSQFRLSPRMAVHWHPSVHAAVTGDTILVTDEGFEIVTPMEDWPKVTVEVKHTPVHCPDILRRAPAAELISQSVLE